jgi:Protein of unknown function (DUF1286)
LKVVTHNIFSFGLGTFLLSKTGHLSLLSLFVALWLTFAVNTLIDVFGHTRKNDVPIRSFVTHSVFTAPLWGAAVGLVTIIVPYSVFNISADSAFELLGAGLGVTIACTHLLLDAFTQAGVYLGRRRIAIAHMSYDNPALNLAFIVLGLLLLAAAFY